MTANHICAPAILDTRRTNSPPRHGPAGSRRGSSFRSLALLTVAGVAFAASPVPAAAQAAPPAAGAEWVRPAGTVQGTRFSSLAQINTTNVARLKEDSTSTPASRRATKARRWWSTTPCTWSARSPISCSRSISRTRARSSGYSIPRPIRSPRARRAATSSIAAPCIASTRPSRRPDHLHRARHHRRSRSTPGPGGEVWRTKLGNVAHRRDHDDGAAGRRRQGVSSATAAAKWACAASSRRSTSTTARRSGKRFSTGPDADVRIGPRSRPFYPKDQGTNLGVTTWPGDHVAASAAARSWAWLTYDPELNLLFHGTANPGSWNHEACGRATTNGPPTVFARGPSTGEAIWAYQITPHDAHDYDGVNENIVVDLPIGGVTRSDRPLRPQRLCLRAGRATGQVLLAPKYFERRTGRPAIDLATGVPHRDEAKQPKTGVNVTDICPAAAGRQGPAAGRLLAEDQPVLRAGQPPVHGLRSAARELYRGHAVHRRQPADRRRAPDGQRGEFFAWDAATGTKAWRIPERFPVWSGALATAGDVVFYGTWTASSRRSTRAPARCCSRPNCRRASSAIR